MTGPLTGGAIGGTIVFALALLATVALIIAGLHWRRTADRYDQGVAFGVVVLGVIAIPIAIGVYVWAMWPFAYEYHHWISTTGAVSTVSKRIVSDGDGNIKEKYVLRLADGRIRAVDDTAAGTLHEGDRVSLRCKKAYDFGVPRSAHGWDCKWAGRRS